MRIQGIVYRSQFFLFLAIVSILLFQYELLMLERGVSLEISLIIFSIAQIGSITAIFTLNKIADKLNTNKLLQISVVFRVIIAAAMFFTDNTVVFIVLFVLYIISSATNMLFEGMMAQWAFTKNLTFGKIRVYGSLGFSAAGYMVSLMFLLTQNINYILLLILGINIINLILVWAFPIDYIKSKEEKGKVTVKLPLKFIWLLVLAAVIMAFPNSFSVVLNNHYREFFGLSVEEAIRFAGTAVFLGSFVAELIGFYTVEDLIRKFGAKILIMAGISLSVFRWIMALVAPNPFIFTLSYFFHGLTFIPIYLGIIGYAKELFGEENTRKVVMQFAMFSQISGVIWIQITNFLINFYSNLVLLMFFAGFSIIIAVIFYVFYLRNEAV